jgi:hypothetical protein
MQSSKRAEQRSDLDFRAELVARLRARRNEIEDAIFARVRRLSEPVGDEDAAYVAGLRTAVQEAVDYGLKFIEVGDEGSVPVPAGATSQARRAAREGVRLDTVLRRYAAGSSLLEEFIVAEADGLPSRVLRQVFRDRSSQVDLLMDTVATAYRDELEQQKQSSTQKWAEGILRLLTGHDLAKTVDVDYDFEVWHLGAILVGDAAHSTARLLAERLGSRLLDLPRDSQTVWAWFGSRRQPVAAELKPFLLANLPAGVSAAIGEPRQGLDGWRQTHREAQIALQVMLEKPKKVIRGRDAVLVAAILRDDMLVRTLLDTYLRPLEEDAHSGAMLLATLRAYFSAGGNAAAAAAELGVTRHTVQRRIRTAEEKLGQLLPTCQAQLQVALEIGELKGHREPYQT